MVGDSVNYTETRYMERWEHQEERNFRGRNSRSKVIII